jgi:hypothetical protein
MAAAVAPDYTQSACLIQASQAFAGAQIAERCAHSAVAIALNGHPMSKPLRKIILIRHAEKPVPDQGILGVDELGNPDRRSLSVRGWQRAGALVRFFVPLHGAGADGAIERPDALFAASPRSKSERPLQTLRNVAACLDLDVHQDFDSDGDEARLIDAARSTASVALVSWRQDSMATFARLLLDDDVPVPDWDKRRFDVAWVFTRERRAWRFTQVPQLLLPGDLPSGIAASSAPREAIAG